MHGCHTALYPGTRAADTDREGLSPVEATTMRRQLFALTLSGLLILGACSSDDTSSDAAKDTAHNSAAGMSGSGPVAEATTCAELTKAAEPVFTKLFQSLVDDAQMLTAEQLAAAAKDVESSKLFTDFEARLQVDGTAIEDKAQALQCSQDDAKAALCAAVDGVDGKGNLLAESMISGMTAECS